jgi:hypothetical protein
MTSGILANGIRHGCPDPSRFSAPPAARFRCFLQVFRLADMAKQDNME